MIHHNVIGLPGTGKTTFLAALWHLLNSEEVETELVLSSLTGDAAYLNRIAHCWRRCEPVPRTSTASEERVLMRVRRRDGPSEYVLRFPDLSGETFSEQVRTRTCTQEYVEGFQGSGGILLFVTADRPTDGIRITDIVDVLSSDAERGLLSETKDWGSEMIPEEVKLVDLLQFVRAHPFERARRRVAVIVSAWDVVPMPQPSAAEWFARELPFLSNFLLANCEDFVARVYGVSAQGADFSASDRKRLLEKTPSERVLCAGDAVRPHDLSGPVAWLSEGA